MYPDPPLSVRLKRHLRDWWGGYVALVVVVVFLLFFDMYEKPPVGSGSFFRLLWSISPFAHGVVVYALFIFITAAGIFALAMGLYTVLTGKVPFGYRTNRDLLQIPPKRSTFDPTKSRDDKSDKQP